MHSCWNLWGTQKLWSVPNCYFIWVSNHWFRGKSAMRQPSFIVCSHSSLQALHDTSWTSLNWLEVLCHPKTHSFIVKFCQRQCVWNIHLVFFPLVVLKKKKKKFCDKIILVDPPTFPWEDVTILETKRTKIVICCWFWLFLDLLFPAEQFLRESFCVWKWCLLKPGSKH